MKTIALFAVVFFLAACGSEEAHDHDHSTDKTPATDMQKMTDKAPAMTDAKTPETGGAEMKTITLSIEGMS